jgi:hypothetical protein
MMRLDLKVDETREGQSMRLPSLRAALSAAEPIYILPKDDVAQSVLIPALWVATNADVMMGFFSSHALGEIAPGLATYLASTSAPLRLVVSPYLSGADRDAIHQGVSEASIAERFLDRTVPGADEIRALGNAESPAGGSGVQPAVRHGVQKAAQTDAQVERLGESSKRGLQFLDRPRMERLVLRVTGRRDRPRAMR